MVTCLLKYQIGPSKLDEFEQYGKYWIDVVNKMGGNHHGYLLPSEGPNNIAYASFSFPSLSDYDDYRTELNNSQEHKMIMNTAIKNGVIISYDRTFMRPLFEGNLENARIYSEVRSS